MPDRPAAQPAPTRKAALSKPRRKWWRRLWKSFLILTLLVVVFHRPLFQIVARFALVQIAARQNINLDVHFSGSIFTNLKVYDIRASPIGTEPNPIERISIKSVNLEYSIPMLIKHGIGEFLRSFEIHHADLVFSGQPSKNKKEKEQKKSVAETLNDLLGQPALYADRVLIDDFSLTVNSPGAPVVVKGINILFHPTEMGYLRIERISVPGVPAWENLNAETSYAKRNLYVKGLALSPELVVEELNYDASQRAQNKGSMDVRARLFGGTLHFSAAGTKLDKRKESLVKAYDTGLRLQAAHIDLPAAAAYFRAPKPPVNTLESLDLRFAGDPEKPRTWKGGASVQIGALALDKAKVDAVNLQAEFKDGQAPLSLVVSTGKTSVKIESTATLPETLNEFAKIEADAKIAIDGPSLAELTGPFLPQPVSGVVKGGGTVSMHQQQLAVDFGLDVTKVQTDTATVEQTQLKILFTGDPQKPRSWKSDVSLRVGPIVSGEAKVDLAQLTLALTQGRLTTALSVAAAGKSAVNLNGTATLPEDLKEIRKTDANFTLGIDAPALEELTAGLMPVPVLGVLKAKGTVELRQQKVVAELKLEASNIKRDTLGVQSAAVTVRVTKDLNVPPNATPLQGMVSLLDAQATGLQVGTFTLDSADVAAETRDQRVMVKQAVMVRGENQVSVQANVLVPPPGTPPTEMQTEFKIKVPKLDQFGLSAGGHVIGGHLEGNGKMQLFMNGPGGQIQLTGGDFTLGDFKAQKLTADVKVAGGEVNVEKLALEIAEGAQVAIAGKLGLQAPGPFEGAVLVLMRDLRILQPLLEAFGIEQPLAGAVDFSLEANGKTKTGELAGKLSLTVDQAKYGAVNLDRFRLAGLFGQNFAQTSELTLKMGQTNFSASVEWGEDRLRIRDIDLKQGTQQALTGFILLPFEPVAKPNPVQAVPVLGAGLPPPSPIPFDKRIAANVNAKDLDIAELLRSFGQQAPANGKLNMNLVLGGSILKPTAHLNLQGRELRSPSAAKLDPAELDFVAHYAERMLTVDVGARLKAIEPLTIKGRIPLDLEAAMKDKQLDPNLPLDLTVKLPTSSLAFVPKLVPAVRSLAGKVGIDAHVGGTVKSPEFSGAAVLKVEYARMKDESVPSIGALDIDIGFSEKEVKMRSFKGELGSGKFELSGGVTFPEKISEPTFNLKLICQEVLVKRDDSITVRISTDLGVTGPMAAGKIAGTVWVTHSRFFRDIDILPIGLPGRPEPKAKPQPREVRRTPGPVAFSLPPPLSAWTFEIAIKTKPDDSFKIQGNLAKGSAAIDLLFGGTGEAPWLDGSVQIENLVATLPFSKLEIQRGFVYFTKDAFAEPTLDISAESQMRDYRINANISGPARQPEISLTSEPPLPQQDIITLLATGTTVSELTGSGDAIASRAVVLLFQSLYRKVFKKKDPMEGLPMADRVTVDIGSADSKTGRQELQASFRLGEQLYLVGDVDIAGQFTGRIRYLLRFK